MFIAAGFVKNLAPLGATCAVVLVHNVALLRSADSSQGAEAISIPPQRGEAADANAIALTSWRIAKSGRY